MSYRFLAGKRSPVDGVDVTLMTDGNSMQGSPSRNHTSYRSNLWTEHGQYCLPAQVMENVVLWKNFCARADIKQCTLPFIALLLQPARLMQAAVACRLAAHIMQHADGRQGSFGPCAPGLSTACSEPVPVECR